MPYTMKARLGRSMREIATHLLFASLLGLLWASVDAASGYAQQDGSDWQTNPSDLQCVPQCRTGFDCRQGECLPVCTPPCGPGLLCTSGGMCVRTGSDEARAAPPPRSWQPSTDQCMPDCRIGFTCLGGHCVSACNPVCPANQQCTPQGQCVPGTAPAVEEPPVTEPKAQPAALAPTVAAIEPVRAASADSVVNFHFDALGVLQFGLTPTIEVGKKVSGYLRVRSFNTGLASYFALRRDRYDELRWGGGVGLGMHLFSGRDGNMRGLFGGPSLEYAYVQSRDLTKNLAEYGTHALIPQLDFGHRWAFNSFLLGLGAQVGLWIPFLTVATPIGIGGCRFSDSCDWKRRMSFVAGVFLDVGWYL